MQKVITYRNDKGELVVYATAYDEPQQIIQVENCRRRYGQGAQVRTFAADKVPAR